MSTVIYRKYRPKNFGSIIGQEHIVSLLKEAISRGEVSHGYLFAGPRGTGKTSTARIFAKAVNCLSFDKSEDACNECEICSLIEKGGEIDIVEVDAASNRGIDEIRELKESVQYAPSVLKKKIYIIDEAHMLTEQAFNALLKTLEEPPSHVILIMATTEPQKIPMTILSRVQRYDFFLASEKNLVSKLKTIAKKEGIDYEDEALTLLYSYTGGSYRDAESLFGKLANSSKKFTLDYVKESLHIVDDNLFHAFTVALYNKNVTEAEVCFKNIIKSINNPAGTVEQYLRFLKIKFSEHLQNKESSEIPISTYMELIEVCIDIKKDMKVFDQKLDVIEYHFLSYALVHKEKSASNVEPELLQEKRSVEKINVVEEKKYPVWVDELRDKDSRCFNILSFSEFDKEKDHLIISNEYQFNLDYLKKPDVLSKIKTLVGSDYSIKLKLLVKKSGLNPKFSRNHNKKNKKTISQDLKDNEVNPDVKFVDNTKLVEKTFFGKS